MAGRIAPLVLAALICAGCGEAGQLAGTAAQDDPASDSDGDGLDNGAEQAAGSDPDDADDPVRWGDRDHDGDGVPNGADGDYSAAGDPDDDGLDNDTEYRLGRGPLSRDWIVRERRPFAALGVDAEFIELQLLTPHGKPLAHTAVTPIASTEPSVLQPIVEHKGWFSDAEGRIRAGLRGLATGRGVLQLVRGSDGDARQLAPIEVLGRSRLHDPPDSERRFSSILDDSLPGSGNARSKIKSSRAWLPADNRAPWIELPVAAGTRVLAVWVRGRADAEQWVSQLRASAEIAPGLRHYARGGAALAASADRNTPVRIVLDLPAGIDAVRLHPSDWQGAPALRAALEVIDNPDPDARQRDSDGDGLSDRLETALGSDPGRADDPQLVAPAASRFAHRSADSGDGLSAPWRALAGDPAPWIEIDVPAGQQLLGLRLSGDPATSAWVSAWRLQDASPPGALSALHEGERWAANRDPAASDHWLPEAGAVRRLRLSALDWRGAATALIQLWTKSSPAAPGSLYADSDGDGLQRIEEIARGLDPVRRDSDGDGLGDGAELALGTDPLAADSDGDGLDDALERRLGGDPHSAADALDSDADGLSDALEHLLGSDPLSADTDGDGLDDAEELHLIRSDPLRADSDGDSLLDGEEQSGPGNPHHPALPSAQPLFDADGDGLNAAREAWLGSDPAARDSDGDGLLDGEEYRAGHDPLDAGQPQPRGDSDDDGDGRPLGAEIAAGSDPADPDDPVAGGSADLDRDGRPNGADPDYRAGADHDGDGLANGAEYRAGSDPADAEDPVAGGAGDHDGDGLANGADADFSVPSELDSDGDGLNDLAEYRLGSDPVETDDPMVGAGADLDDDGLRNGADPDYDPGADDDGDGWSNSAEYRADTDPTQANTAADFPSLELSGAVSGQYLLRYPLPDSGSGAPFYSSDPALLNAIAAPAPQPIARGDYQGFSSAAIALERRDGQLWLRNLSPRHFRSLGLRWPGEDAPRLIDGAVAAFAEHPLGELPAGTALLLPSPLGPVAVSEFAALDRPEGPARVPAEHLGAYRRLALAWQRRLNTPAWWQRVEQALSSGCAAALCADPGAARAAIEALFSGAPAQLLGTAEEAVQGEGWQAQPAAALDELSAFGAGQLAALGLRGPALVAIFAPPRDAAERAALAAETRRGRAPAEAPLLYALRSEPAARRLSLRLYSRRALRALWFFSRAGGGPATLQYRGASGEFVLGLEQAQWDTGRARLLFESADGGAEASIELRW